MEVPGGHKNLFRVMLYEAIGTAFLLIGVNWGAANDCKLQAECVALSLFAIAMIIGPISGGHVNPAVSTGVLLMEGNFAKNIGIYLAVIVA